MGAFALQNAIEHGERDCLVCMAGIGECLFEPASLVFRVELESKESPSHVLAGEGIIEVGGARIRPEAGQEIGERAGALGKLEFEEIRIPEQVGLVVDDAELDIFLGRDILVRDTEFTEPLVE